VNDEEMPGGRVAAGQRGEMSVPVKPQAKQNVQPISDADSARLDTWIAEITTELRSGAPQSIGSEGEIRVGRQGSLALYPDGHWFDYEADQYGPGAFALVLHELEGEPHAAVQWVREWLRMHPGNGARQPQRISSDEAAARAQRHAEWAHWVLQHLVPIEGTISEVYLTARGLPPPYPADLLSHLERGRRHEGALVAKLTDEQGNVLGVQLGFLALDGRKSTQPPPRQQFWLEPDPARRQTGLFRMLPMLLTADVDKVACLVGSTLVAEGVENSLSLARAFPHAAMLGLPGIGRLRRIPPIKGDVIILRDGDEPDSTADKALIRGIDHLLLTGTKTIRVTETPPGEDANSILQRGGMEAVRTLIDVAKPAALSADGEAQRLARIRDPILYAQAVKAVAKTFGVDKAAVEAKVAAKRKAMRVEEGDEDNTPFAGIIKHEPTPWTGQVVLGEVFDELVDLLGRLLVCSAAEQRVIAAWIMHSYVAEQFTYTPRLCIISPAPRCGKTTLVNILTVACYRPAPAEHLSPALFTRLRSVVGPCTVILDEIGEVLHATPELDDVLRSGFERGKQAFKLRAMPDGSFVPEAYEVFNPVAIAVLRTPPAALADRCLMIRLQRKPKNVAVERMRRRDVRAKVQLIADKLAKWRLEDGAALSDDPPYEGGDDPIAALTAALETSSANDRQIDFSVPLLVIGHAMGGHRERQLRDAILAVLGADGDTPESIGTMLLQDLQTVLAQYRTDHPQIPVDALELGSAELVRLLLAIPDAPWNGEGNIRPLTQHRLSRLLKTYSVFPRWVGPEAGRLRGYSGLQLWEAAERYVGIAHGNPPFQSVQSVQNRRNSRASEEFQSVQEELAAHFEIPLKPAEISHSAHSAHFETGNSAAHHVGSPDTPDFSNQGAKDYSLQKGAETPSPGPAEGEPAHAPPSPSPPPLPEPSPAPQPRMTSIIPLVPMHSRWRI
jgi:hypothetical protein